MSRWLAILVAVLTWVGVAPDVAAAVVRYAVVIGNNDGASDEQRLRYAESDATKLGSVLSQLGRFPPENTIVLHGESPEVVRRVLIAVNDRIRSDTNDGDEAVLFVYYSGHADAEHLHLGDEEFSIRTLRQLVRGSSANVRMLMLDACRSGALTRVKGVRTTKRFDVKLDETLDHSGMVLLTSSSASEDAQESDELRGSFFTHYFVSGLLGAADADGDGAVTLSEAYAHAYDSTLRASSQTLHGVQHPTFAMNIKGKDDFVLTWLGDGVATRARVRLPEGRTSLLFAGGRDGSVVAEVGSRDAVREVSVEPGRYFVRARSRDHLLEGTIRVKPGEVRVVRTQELERIEYARLARKGGTERRLAHGPQVAYQLASGLWPGSGPCHGVRAGYAVDHRWLTVVPRLGWCRADPSGSVLPTTHDLFDVDVTLTHVFDLPVVAVGVGVAGGTTLQRQAFATTRVAPTNLTVGGHAGVVLSLTWDLPAGVYLLSDVSGQAHMFRARTDDRVELRFTPVVRGTFGVGKRF
jgi:hypothetical protein